jgi:hypothetical protein
MAFVYLTTLPIAQAYGIGFVNNEWVETWKEAVVAECKIQNFAWWDWGKLRKSQTVWSVPRVWGRTRNLPNQVNHNVNYRAYPTDNSILWEVNMIWSSANVDLVLPLVSAGLTS